MAAKTPAIQVQILGAARAFIGQEEHSFINDKRFQLLSYLAWAGDWVSRDKLAELLWSDAGETTRQNLRSLLGRVQEMEWLNGLEVERSRLRWAVPSDWAEFQQALKNADTEGGLAVYNGSFLQGLDSYEDNDFAAWLEFEREHLHAQWRRLLFSKVEALKKAQHHEQASHLLLKLLGADAFDEEALLLHLELLALAGKYAQAVKDYQDFARRLTREMGVEPSSATVQFAQRLKQQSQARRGEVLSSPERSVALTPQRSVPSTLSLPSPSTSFIGRDLELAEMANLLEKGCRLLTILGPGGVGKTRVALQIAGELGSRYQGGACFVALEAVQNPAGMVGAIAQALNIPLKAGTDPLQQVTSTIAGQHLLLVLDNFEHLMEAAVLASELLKACPHLALLVTSRERLNLDEEHLLLLEGLATPQSGESLEDARRYEAIQLFCERASRVRPGFVLEQSQLKAVIQICQMVQGFPLGIELAAVWVRLMPCEQIATEIEGNLDFLTSTSRNAVERHRSIRATFEYSWKHLSEREQQTLRKLSVFQGGFSKEAATVVADANIALLAALVDKSLLRVSEGRYDFHPLLYQYAGEKLAENPEEHGRSRARHGQYFLNLIEASQQAGPQTQIKCGKAEHKNLLAALAWSQESSEALVGLRLGNALAHYWLAQVYYDEGSLWLSRVLAHPGAQPASEERTKALLHASRIATRRSDRTQAVVYGQEALAISQKLGLEELRVQALLFLGSEWDYQGRHAESQQYHQQALELAQKLEQGELVAQALHLLGNSYSKNGDQEKARELLEESLAHFRKLGLWFHIQHTLTTLGFTVWNMGDLKAARGHMEEALRIPQDLVDLQVACTVKSNLSGIMLDLGDLSAASIYGRESLEFRWEHKDRWGLAFSLENHGDLAVVRGNTRQACRLWGVAERLREETRSPMFPRWQARQHRFITMARNQLDEASFAAAWQEGRGMGLEEAVQYALHGDVRESELGLGVKPAP